MFGAIISPIANLAGTWLEGKVATTKANAEVKVDRKILADLAINDPDGFKKLVDLAKKNINA